jgi:hypothetical protein
MKRVILIGRWFKEKRSTVIDLQAYRQLKQESRRTGETETGRNGDQTNQRDERNQTDEIDDHNDPKTPNE